MGTRVDRERVSGLVGPEGTRELAWLLWNCIHLVCGSILKVPGKLVTEMPGLFAGGRGVSHVLKSQR